MPVCQNPLLYELVFLWMSSTERRFRIFMHAAGECCAQYHGTNRLGGNSLLGALWYGGRVAAKSACEQADGVVLSCAAQIDIPPVQEISEQKS